MANYGSFVSQGPHHKYKYVYVYKRNDSGKVMFAAKLNRQDLKAAHWFENDREAAKYIDLMLLKAGKEPVNGILCRK
jgi:hypothetical protein